MKRKAVNSLDHGLLLLTITPRGPRRQYGPRVSVRLPA
jgi:hypothetical protein